MNIWDKVSEWERHRHQKHPLISQVVTRTVSGILVVFLLWIFAKARPVFTEERTTQTDGRITVTNKGLLPLNAKYSILSEDTSVVLPQGQVHVTVYPGKEEKVKILEVNNLPAATSAIIGIKGTGSAQVKDVSGNTVLFYPSQAKNIVGDNTVELR